MVIAASSAWKRSSPRRRATRSGAPRRRSTIAICHRRSPRLKKLARPAIAAMRGPRQCSLAAAWRSSWIRRVTAWRDAIRYLQCALASAPASPRVPDSSCHRIDIPVATSGRRPPAAGSSRYGLPTLSWSSAPSWRDKERSQRVAAFKSELGYKCPPNMPPLSRAFQRNDPLRPKMQKAGQPVLQQGFRPSSIPFGMLSGGAEGDRTLDLRDANATLSQLSYRPT